MVFLKNSSKGSKVAFWANCAFALKDAENPLRALIKSNWRFKYQISRLSKMASTKGIYGTGIKKLKYKK